MNKTEMAYAQYLEAKKAAGEVAWYKFEAMKLRLADNTFYSPDFCRDASKWRAGNARSERFWADDARVKIKVAADMHPFRFIAVRVKPKKDGGGWAVEEF